MAVGVGTDSAKWARYTTEDLGVFGAKLTAAEMGQLNRLDNNVSGSASDFSSSRQNRFLCKLA